MSQYQKLMASAKIPFQGKELNLAGLQPFFASGDRQVRLAAQQARSDFFEANAEAFDALFDELVKVADSHG